MPLQVIPRRDRKLNSLIKAATPTWYRKGDVVYRRGDTSALVLLVQDGHVRLTFPKTGAAGDRIVGVAGPKELLGLEAVTLDVPRRYTAIAGSPCTVPSPERGRRVQGASGVSQNPLAIPSQ